jgi:hypothetical protein
MQLMRRYPMPLAELKPGAAVQIIAGGGWPYEAIVTSVGKVRSRVEFATRHGGFRERTLKHAFLFKPNALQSLRAERLCGCGLAQGHEGSHASHEDGTPL